MATDHGLPIELEFAGGAELLVKNKEKLQKIVLPVKTDKSQWTLKCVSEWIKNNLLSERPELFLVNNNVRPGILVLVNDTDWELLGQEDYVVKDNDKITFISTLHGGELNDLLKMQQNAKLVATEFVTFLNKAVSPYHAVDECSRLLTAAGFSELKESEQWKIEPMKKYYVTRNKSTIIAFAVGGKFRPGNGVAMIAAHTDSPNLRVKPVSKLSSAGCLQVGVMTYGGGIWRTWFDRDLTVAGRVIVKGVDGKINHQLAHIKRPILCIPNLAIHLDRETNEKFTFNKEDHLKPILATQIVHAFSSSKANLEKDDDKTNEHHPAFLQALADNINVQPSNILDFDLCVIDTQPAQIGGLYEEFVFGPRLDNLVGTYTSITALIKSLAIGNSLQNDPTIRLVACFDNEECGSESAQGAQSSLTEWVLRRLQSDDTSESSSKCLFEQSISRSFLISADQAHAVHPNYKSKHEDNHSPAFHKGVVLKINPNQRYATTTITSSILKQIAERAQVPLQKFVVRNDTACGSTVGPIMSAKLGLQTVDVGTPQLAMHSAREMACTTGIFYAQELFTKFFETYDEVQNSFNI